MRSIPIFMTSWCGRRVSGAAVLWAESNGVAPWTATPHISRFPILILQSRWREAGSLR